MIRGGDNVAINYPQRYDDDFLNTIKTVIDHVNTHGKTIQDLVADGKLTEEQYGNLITTINNMVKSGEVDKNDLTPEFKGEIEGFSTQLAQKANQSYAEGTNKRIDELIIGSGDANAEVTDAHVSLARNKTFDTLSGRIEKTESELMNFFDIRINNMIDNGDFSDGLNGWNVSSGTANTNEGKVTVLPLDPPESQARVMQKLTQRNVGEVYYFSAQVKSTTQNVHFFSNGPVEGTYDGSNVYRKMSMLYTAPSDSSDWNVGVCTIGYDTTAFSVDSFVVVNLTELYGAGNEPTLEKFEGYLKNPGHSLFFKEIVANSGVEEAVSKTKEIEPVVFYEGYPEITNMVQNGNFEYGGLNWNTTGGATNFSDNKAHIEKESNNTLYFEQRLSGKRVKGHKYYISVTAKSYLPSFGLSSNGAIIVSTTTQGDGKERLVSTIFDAPVDLAEWDIGVASSSIYEGSLIISNVMTIDLTQAYGVGNEPTKKEVDNLIERFLGGYFEGTETRYANVKKELENTKKQIEQISGEKSNNYEPIDSFTESHPIMCAVKMSNAKDSTIGYAEPPRPLGWLYYDQKTYDFYYAKGSPENMKYLFTWNESVSWEGKSTPRQYRAFITKEGDIIFVWRGDLRGSTTNATEVRQNPIVYPAGDYKNPVEVDLGEGLKPTAWLQNCGAEYVYNEDVFLFSEYTRPAHLTAHIWKVTKPFTDPANWKTKMAISLPEVEWEGLKHFHTVTYDTFSSVLYATTGDHDLGAKIYESTDLGESWTVVMEGDRSYARVLNFSFTKEGALWSTDDNLHFLNYAPRVNGVIDFSQSSRIYDLNGYPPTYGTALLDDPYGLLILNRKDTYNDGKIDVLFWDIESETMHTISTLETIRNPIEDGEHAGEYMPWGFRMEAFNFYPSRGDNRIVVGFNDPPNYIKVAGNVNSPDSTNLLGNLVLQVTEVEGRYGLKISSINDRS